MHEGTTLINYNEPQPQTELKLHALRTLHRLRQFQLHHMPWLETFAIDQRPGASRNAVNNRVLDAFGHSAMRFAPNTTRNVRTNTCNNND